MTDVVMPKLGLTQEYGTIIEWRKKLGDPVQVGDVLLVVETDKVATEVEAEESGVLDRILVEEGTEVPVFTRIAVLRPPEN